MSRTPPNALVVLLFGIALASPVFATTYYVAANGSDSNSGTSKTSPWLHAPGMANASGSAAGTTLKPGDSVVLRGCDTWTISGQWNISTTATSASHLQVGGLDQTWYNSSVCPSNWNRPILSGNGTFPGSAGNGSFIYLNNSSYVEIAFIEFTGLNWSANITGSVVYINQATATNSLYHDNYAHGWSHSAGVVEEQGSAFIYAIAGGGSSAYNNVCDGSDTSEDAFTCMYSYHVDYIYNNVFKEVMSGIIGSWTSLHDNLFDWTALNPYAGSGSHNNTAESNTDPSGGSLTYNNVIMHMNPGGANNGVGLQLAPQSGDTSYVFNNVLIDTFGGNSGNNLMVVEALTNPGGNATVFNNTIECGSNAMGAPNLCTRIGSLSGANPSEGQINNHFVTTQAAPALVNSCNCNVTYNTNPQLVQPLNSANAQGYSMSQTYAFSPTASSGATVGQGVNESSLCTIVKSIDSAAGSACMNDTTYAVTETTLNGVVQAANSGRTTVPRPSSGAWDAGAYFFSGSTVNPPTGLAAIVN